METRENKTISLGADIKCIILTDYRTVQNTTATTMACYLKGMKQRTNMTRTRSTPDTPDVRNNVLSLLAYATLNVARSGKLKNCLIVERTQPENLGFRLLAVELASHRTRVRFHQAFFQFAQWQKNFLAITGTALRCNHSLFKMAVFGYQRCQNSNQVILTLP